MGWFSPSLKTKISRFERLMPERVKKMVGNWYDANFEVGGYRRAKSISRWQPRLKNYKHLPLQKTGRLRNSQVVLYEKNRITVEYKAPYAKYHNDKTGTWSPNVQRKFLDDNPTLVKEVKKFIMQEYKKIIR